MITESQRIHKCNQCLDNSGERDMVCLCQDFCWVLLSCASCWLSVTVCMENEIQLRIAKHRISTGGKDRWKVKCCTYLHYCHYSSLDTHNFVLTKSMSYSHNTHAMPTIHTHTHTVTAANQTAPSGCCQAPARRSRDWGRRERLKERRAVIERLDWGTLAD